ncbi:NAD(P)H-binding protein [Levilactobacillus suantsaiihabitans]|uniref:NAD(P)-dependent oxidoreductase n=1 Tax=Levilactobacillus suantsaiihabitans TaxID=2487722 RepID=A0A4Z0J9D5_9LACO|nr:NAD(P)H-binding protein [Levilactobacillus suantsaiihabitans]TGD18363.1 NAD(P)-dependent oxidoreductase [Levilactobacillus suantsaiihabitans]
MILAANGQIARLVEHRILTEAAFQDVALTLFLRHASRLNDLQDNPRVTLIEGDITDADAVAKAMAGQNLVFVAVVDHDRQNRLTKNVIAGMQAFAGERAFLADQARRHVVDVTLLHDIYTEVLMSEALVVDPYSRMV